MINTTAAKKPVTKTTKNEPTLKDICKELGISPVAARRKLRKVWRAKDTKVDHTKRQAWSGAWLRSVLAPKPAKSASK
jgi:hypothetical protein